MTGLLSSRVRGPLAGARALARRVTITQAKQLNDGGGADAALSGPAAAAAAAAVGMPGAGTDAVRGGPSSASVPGAAPGSCACRSALACDLPARPMPAAPKQESRMCCNSNASGQQRETPQIVATGSRLTSRCAQAQGLHSRQL